MSGANCGSGCTSCPTCQGEVLPEPPVIHDVRFGMAMAKGPLLAGDRFLGPLSMVQTVRDAARARGAPTPNDSAALALLERFAEHQYASTSTARLEVRLQDSPGQASSPVMISDEQDGGGPGPVAPAPNLPPLPTGPTSDPDWWRGRPVTPMTPMSEQGPCPPPKRWEWMQGPNGEGGHWVCVLPPENTRWVNDHWEPWHGLQVGWIPPPNLCCCPKSIKIVGGNSDNSYDLEQTARDAAMRPDCRGQAFEVLIEVEWLPSEEWQPCTLEWWEQATNLNDFRQEDQYAKEKQRHKGVTSPTISPWAESMDPDAIGRDSKGAFNNSDQRKEYVAGAKLRVSEKKAGKETIALVDSPCISPGDLRVFGDSDQGFGFRELHGHIIVRPGCPAGSKCSGEPQEAFWAQRVLFDGDRLVESFLAQDPPFKPTKSHSKGPAESSTPNGYTPWKNRMEKEWARIKAKGR